ncbi:MAG: sulfur oxidation c-type cytochrome SoxX [Pseudomonadota bacterium]
MKHAYGLALTAAIFATPALSGDIAPQDVVYKDGIVEASLTGTPGDPVVGRAVFANRKQGNCLACHANADLSEESFHGEVAPMLDGVADRWTEPELRSIVTNAKVMFEGTMMPAFYIDTGYVRPLEGFEGKSILTAQQVEDVVAYLMTLKEE